MKDWITEMINFRLWGDHSSRGEFACLDYDSLVKREATLKRKNLLPNLGNKFFPVKIALFVIRDSRK